MNLANMLISWRITMITLKTKAAVFAATIVISSIVGPAGYLIGKYELQLQAVKQGAARYNQTTGAWEWGKPIDGSSGIELDLPHQSYEPNEAQRKIVVPKKVKK